MMVISFLLLMLAPSPDSAAPPQSYEQALTQLEAAEDWADSHEGAEACERLELALAALDPFALELAGDEEGRESVLFGRLSLVRGYLRLPEPEVARAEALLEGTMRTSSVPTSVLDRFRPYFEGRELVIEQRLEAAGKGLITVTCHLECEVAIDSYPLVGRQAQVFLGSHAVTVRSVEGELAPAVFEVVLDTVDEQVDLVFGALPEPASEKTLSKATAEPEPDSAGGGESEAEADSDPLAAGPRIVAPAPTQRPLALDDPPRGPAPLLPRWVETSALVGGAGLVAVGALLLPFDQTCTDPALGSANCPRIWESTPGAIVSLALGGAVLLSAATLLGVDERRRKRRSAQIFIIDFPGTLRF